MTNEFPPSYITTVTVISGWFKLATVCFTAPTLLTLQKITDWLAIKLILALGVGPILGLGFSFLILDVLNLQNQVNLTRLLFFDIILTLAFLFGTFISKAFILTAFFWSFLSVIGILLSPIPASDPGVSKATRLLGFLILGIGLPLKFVDVGSILSNLSSLCSILGGVLGIAGEGHNLR
ncbi:MAG: hypothetical protein GWO20_17345 [Candidatus Korarchaeota archaeon]|nr:hypothetical protein [Candidatus Korarchaeota archaeon]NIU81993.1 hypothetical protein [Candidatus Thorarchaeota archaeon]NIW15160.1 hypothetical protein [Candidatus Thorarchaeota archaeon]NIW53150.1 hypothetical protein [Candidatus Korarchaeota archaeon]